MISTSERHAEHLFAGQNTQQTRTRKCMHALFIPSRGFNWRPSNPQAHTTNWAIKPPYKTYFFSFNGLPKVFSFVFGSLFWAISINTLAKLNLREVLCFCSELHASFSLQRLDQLKFRVKTKCMGFNSLQNQN